MLFANISSDKIQFILDGEETTIEHVDLEKTIAHFLNSKFKMQNSQSNKVFIINGPGSFTNLRIATLSLNMFNYLNNNSVDIYSIDKLTLYKKLYQKKLLPPIGYIYIGQKKNRRQIDLQTMEHSQILIHNSEMIDHNSAFFVDYVFDHSQLENLHAQCVQLGRVDEDLVVKFQ